MSFINLGILGKHKSKAETFQLIKILQVLLFLLELIYLVLSLSESIVLQIKYLFVPLLVDYDYLVDIFVGLCHDSFLVNESEDAYA
jgi:hypothetical protein